MAATATIDNAGKDRRMSTSAGLRALVMLTALVGALFVLPPAANASLPGFRTVASGSGWVDFTGDGRADYCRFNSSDNRLRCTVVTPSHTFGATVISATTVDGGYTAGRAWTDFNGDGRADYCRVVGVWVMNLSCTVSTGSGFGATYTSGLEDPGYDATRAWVDVNADGRSDYCRVVGSSTLRCTLSTGTGFGAQISTTITDAGYDAGRAWVDFTGDGRPDYCVVIGGWDKKLKCHPFTGSGFGTAITSGVVDAGYDVGRAWVDVNGDRRADYCRRVGWGDQLQCTLSAGGGFGVTFTSTGIDTGYDWSVGWGDVNGDGRDDFCRQVSGGARCLLSQGTGFGPDLVYSGPIGVNGPVGWVDVNADHLADFCRVASGTAYCSLSTGSGFGLTFAGSVIPV